MKKLELLAIVVSVGGLLVIIGAFLLAGLKGVGAALAGIGIIMFIFGPMIIDLY